MSLAEWYRAQDWQAFAAEFKVQYELTSDPAEKLRLLRSILVEYRHEAVMKAVIESGALS